MKVTLYQHGCCSVAQGLGYQFQKQSNPEKTEGRICGFCRAGWQKWEDIGMGFPLGVMGTVFLQGVMQTFIMSCGGGSLNMVKTMSYILKMEELCDI